MVYLQDDLAMWKQNSSPRIQYTLMEGGGKHVMLEDVVKYTNLSGKSKSISGIDVLREVSPGRRPPRLHFRWRGTGCLRFITSDWQFIYGGIESDGTEWAMTVRPRPEMLRASLYTTRLNSVRVARA